MGRAEHRLNQQKRRRRGQSRNQTCLRLGKKMGKSYNLGVENIESISGEMKSSRRGEAAWKISMSILPRGLARMRLKYG